MIIKIYLHKNTALNSHKIKSPTLLCLCAVDVNGVFVPCWGSAALWIAQGGTALGMNQAGTVEEAQMLVVDAFVSE